MGDGRRRRPQKFWDEIAAESERKAKVVQILKDYTRDHGEGRPALPHA